MKEARERVGRGGGLVTIISHTLPSASVVVPSVVAGVVVSSAAASGVALGGGWRCGVIGILPRCHHGPANWQAHSHTIQTGSVARDRSNRSQTLTSGPIPVEITTSFKQCKIDSLDFCSVFEGGLGLSVCIVTRSLNLPCGPNLVEITSTTSFKLCDIDSLVRLVF